MLLFHLLLLALTLCHWVWKQASVPPLGMETSKYTTTGYGNKEVYPLLGMETSKCTTTGMETSVSPLGMETSKCTTTGMETSVPPLGMETR